jgi:hypothetical protein
MSYYSIFKVNRQLPGVASLYLKKTNPYHSNQTECDKGFEWEKRYCFSITKSSCPSWTVSLSLKQSSAI